MPDVTEMVEALASPPPIPPSASEAAASEEALADLSDADAIAAAQEAFPELMETRLVPELELSETQNTGSFLDRFTVQVKNDGPGPDAVVESTLPIRAPEGGSQELLDADLEAERDHFEVANAIVESEIADDPAEGIKIPELDLGVVPVSDPNAETTVVEDKVIVANSAVDTDTLIAPTALGTSINYLIRSADAPEVERLELELPKGAVLMRHPDDTITIQEGSEIIGQIEAPSAVDSVGQPVEVAYDLSSSGSEVEVEVSHRDQGFVYPIHVDPVVGVAAQYPWSSGQSSIQNWFPYKNPTTSAYTFSNPPNSPGVAIRAPIGSHPPVGSFGEWVVNSYPNTFIEQVDYYYVDHLNNPYNQQQTCTLEGLWQNGNWTVGSYYNAQTLGTVNNVAWVDICGGNLYDQSRSFWVGNHKLPDSSPTSGDAEGAIGNQGLFMLMTTADGYYNPRTTDADSLLAATTVWRYDWSTPTIAGTPPTGWVDDSNALDTSKRATFSMADNGLGVHRLEVRQGTGATNALVSTTNHGCNGAHQAPCPSSYTLGTQLLPEGSNQLSARAIDAGGRESARITWTASVDRTAPTIQTPGGSLYVNRSNLQSDQSYTLDLSATDGSTSQASLMRSGVKSIDVYIDAESSPRYTVSRECLGTQGSCPINPSTVPGARWQLPFDELPGGSHTVRLVASDFLNHAQELQFSINVTNPLDPPATPTAICGTHTNLAEAESDELMQVADPMLLGEIGEARFGTRYGGAWVERTTCPSMVHVSLRNSTAAERTTLLQAFAADPRFNAQRVIVDNVAFTESDLEHGGEVAGDILRAHAIRPFTTSHDLRSQQVVVEARAVSAAVRAEVDAAVSPAVVFRTDPAYVGATYQAQTREDFPPYLGNLRITFPTLNGVSSCTSGFTMTRSSPRRYYATSAGHCADVGERAYIGNNIDTDEVGEVLQDTTTAGDTRSDLALIKLKDSYASRRVFSSPNHSRLVTDRINNVRGAYHDDRILCFNGATTGHEVCGPIEDHLDDEEPEVNTGPSFTFRNAVCIEGSTELGDSGGAVYDKRADGSVRAAGWVSFEHDPVLGGTSVCFGRIWNGLNALDAQIAIAGK